MRIQKIQPVLHTKVSAYLIKITFYVFCTYTLNVKDFYRKKCSPINTERSLCANELDDSRTKVTKSRLNTWRNVRNATIITRNYKHRDMYSSNDHLCVTLCRIHCLSFDDISVARSALLASTIIGHCRR